MVRASPIGLVSVWLKPHAATTGRVLVAFSLSSSHSNVRRMLRAEGHNSPAALVLLLSSLLPVLVHEDLSDPCLVQESACAPGRSRIQIPFVSLTGRG